MAIKSKTYKNNNDPLQIWHLMSALDRKDYSYYDNLNDDQKKEIQPYLLFRWGSTVQGNNDIAKYYTIAANSFVNENFWEIKDKKLQWLLCCTISPNIGKQKHYWLGASKKSSGSKLKKALIEAFPNKKEDEVDLMISLNKMEDFIEYFRGVGWEDEKLKELTKK